MGCGHASRSTPPELRLQRADLIDVAHALAAAEPQTVSEVAATKAAWPLVANGLPADVSTLARGPIRNAVARSGALTVPLPLRERQSQSLTGPGSSIAGSYRSYVGLSSRGWSLLEGFIEQIQHGPPVAASFARANYPLYIDSVYDAHFGLAQIGKQLTEGYRKLGGADAFGPSLTPAAVERLADAYSEAGDRLHPHPAVSLGS